MQPLGQPVTSTFKTYSDAAKTTLADATTVVLSLRDPRTGAVTTPAVTHTPGSGIYTYTLPDDVPGLWMGRWVATGAVATTSSLTWALSVNEAWPPALIGLDDARAELNFTATTDDDELQGYIYTASALLLNHPAYRVAEVSKVQTFTQDWVRGGDTVILDYYENVVITSVTEYSGGTGTVLAAEGIDTASPSGYGYRVDPGGLLRRLSGGYCTSFLGPVRVVYTAGNASVPWDVRQACLALIDHMWESQQGGAGLGQPPGYDAESLPGSFGDVYGPSFALPNRVKEMLEPYRKAPAVA